MALLPHQKTGLDWMRERERERGSLGGIIGDEMGMGKTRMVLTHIQRSDPGATLLITPASVRLQWMSEAKALVDGRKLRCLLYNGKKKSVRFNNYDLVLVSYENLVLDSERDQKLLKSLWSRVILDEAHRIRNPRSKTFLSVMRLSSKYRWSISGTIIQNKVFELAQQIRYLRIAPHNTYSCYWCGKCESTEPPGRGACVQCNCPSKNHQLRFANDILSKLLPGTDSYVTAKRELDEILENVMLRRTKCELGLDPPVETVQYVELNTVERKLYTDFELSIQLGDQFKMSHAFTLLLRLRQLCNFASCSRYCSMCLVQLVVKDEVCTSMCGHSHHARCGDGKLLSVCPLCMNPIKPILLNRILSCSKVETVLNLIHSSNDKILIFSNFLSTIDIVSKRLDLASIEHGIVTGSVNQPRRQTIQDKFNSPTSEMKVMLLSLTAGGEGLNLGAARLVIIMDPWWNPQIERQAAHRAHRLFSTSGVRIIKVITRDTVEERIQNLQHRKQAVFDAILANSPIEIDRLDVKYLLSRA